LITIVFGPIVRRRAREQLGRIAGPRDVMVPQTATARHAIRAVRRLLKFMGIYPPA
jgi:hypothetical protein